MAVSRGPTAEGDGDRLAPERHSGCPVRPRCCAATGNRAQELDPPVEDEVAVPLG
ncbi:hypothetical protein [Streptomyces pactum]|uniref:hypothetical protein n=1 Tax=Streptomyces pactum TaxID=68249 RepID=UPI00142D5748|nr:hypothetical protein [Streptomyces pactum]